MMLETQSSKKILSLPAIVLVTAFTAMLLGAPSVARASRVRRVHHHVHHHAHHKTRDAAKDNSATADVREASAENPEAASTGTPAGQRLRRRAHAPKASAEVIELFQKPVPTPEPEDFRHQLAPMTLPSTLAPTH